MLGHGFSRFAVPALTAAVLLWTAGLGWAQHGGGHGGGGHGGGGHGGGGHVGAGHFGGGHFGGGHFGPGHFNGGFNNHFHGGFNHHFHSAFFGGFYPGWYPGFYGYGGGYYPGAYQSFYYPYADTYSDVPYYPDPSYLLGPSLASAGSPWTALGNAALPLAPSAAPLRSGAAVNFNVQVPPDAEVWIEGQKTNQAGVVRQFESPPLSPGMDYQYQIRARWTEGGTVLDQTRKLRVHAGDRFSVSFGNPAPAPGNGRHAISRP